MPGSIIGFLEVSVINELTDKGETAIAVILLRDNREVTRENGKACCCVGFLGRNLIKYALLYIGRYAEVQELLEIFFGCLCEMQEQTWIWSSNFFFFQ